MIRFHRFAAIGLVAVRLLSAQADKGQPHTSTPDRVQKVKADAEAARTAGKADDAIALYKKGVALQPAWDEGWWYLGTIYYNLDQYKDAQSAFKHLVILKPEVAVGWGMLGLCEFRNNDFSDSLRNLQRAIDLGIGSDQEISDVVHYHYAMLLTRASRFEEAMRALALFAQRNVDTPEYVEVMGLASLRKPLLPADLPPGERELVLDIGRAMFDAAGLKTAKAASEFKQLVAKFPQEPNVHYSYGSFLLFSDVDQGLAELKKELDINPGSVPTLVTLASEYLRIHDFAEALPFARRAAAADPQSFAAHAVLGRVLFEGNIDADAGLKELEEARKLEPSSPQVRSALASAYTKLGRKTDAANERAAFLELRKASNESEKTVQ